MSFAEPCRKGRVSALDPILQSFKTNESLITPIVELCFSGGKTMNSIWSLFISIVLASPQDLQKVESNHSNSHQNLYQNMKFHYVPVEGEPSTLCYHTRIRDLPDWDIACPTNYGKKTFSAHVVLRQYSGADKTGLELLYWVTEPGETPRSIRKYHSTSALMKFKGSTDLMGLSIGQGVENDQAYLNLTWGQ